MRSLRRALWILCLPLGLLALDRVLAHAAVHINAAGALLSPSGEVSLEALAVALAFLFTRVALVGSVALCAAWLAASALSARGGTASDHPPG